MKPAKQIKYIRNIVLTFYGGRHIPRDKAKSLGLNIARDNKILIITLTAWLQ